MLVIGAIGLKFGNPARLLYGTDYKGQVCGSAAAVASKKFIAYPRTNEDFLNNLQKSSPLDYTFYGICLSACPASLDVLCNYDTAGAPADQLGCLTSTNATVNGLDCDTVRANCWVNPQKTSSVLFHCIPVYNVTNTASAACTFPAGVALASDPGCILAIDTTFGSVERPAKPNMLFDQLNTMQRIWGRWFGDLARASWVILLVSVGLALLLGLFYTQFLKYFTGCMVWTTIVLTNLLIIFLTCVVARCVPRCQCRSAPRHSPLSDLATPPSPLRTSAAATSTTRPVWSSSRCRSHCSTSSQRPAAPPT